jgi:hypothetical protein
VNRKSSKRLTLKKGKKREYNKYFVQRKGERNGLFKNQYCE